MKNTFRFLMPLMALCILLAGVACSKEAHNDALVGKWVEYDESMNGKSLLGGQPLPFEMIYSFTADGSLEYVNNAGVKKGTYQVKDDEITIRVENVPAISYKIESVTKEELALKNEGTGVTMKFKAKR